MIDGRIFVVEMFWLRGELSCLSEEVSCERGREGEVGVKGVEEVGGGNGILVIVLCNVGGVMVWGGDGGKGRVGEGRTK